MRRNNWKKVPMSETSNNLKGQEQITEFLNVPNIFGQEKELLRTELLNDTLEELMTSDGVVKAIAQVFIENLINSYDITEQKLVGLARNMAKVTNLDEKGNKSIERERLSKQLLTDDPDLVMKALEEKGQEIPTDPQKIIINKKVFKTAMLQDIGDVFCDCPMSEEKKTLMEYQLAEKHAQEWGITLKDSDLDITLQDLEAGIEQNVNNWLQTLPINISNENEEKEMENKTTKFLGKMVEMVPLGNIAKMDEETKAFMQEIPIDSEVKNDSNFINDKAAELVDKLSLIPQKALGQHPNMSYKGLTNFIPDWFDNINITDDTKDKEELKNMTKDLAHDFMRKIGEMNVDPKIFNDKSLYEDSVKDDLQNLLSSLTITDENFQEKKENLIQAVKDAQTRAHNEIAGQNFKQKLRDTISTTLPDQRNLSQEELATMEILKDQLADAFIDLHFSGGNDELRAKMKNKIADEINNFCKNYSERHPEAPLSHEQLTHDIYKALQNIAFPLDDSMKYEVEQVRVRDLVNDWVKGLPLEPQSPTDLITRNKMIYVLSKKIFDIETEATPPEVLPNMRKEILQFLKKMPLKPGENKKVHKFANQLIDRVKATKILRRYSDSTFVNIDSAGNITAQNGGRRSDAQGSRPRASFADTHIGAPVPPGLVPGGAGVTKSDAQGSGPRASFANMDYDEDMCPYYNYFCKRVTRDQKNRHLDSFAPCSLSPEDLEHLERIRQRTCMTPNCITALLKSNKRNAGVASMPVDTGSQTELRQDSDVTKKSQEIQVCPSANQLPRPCPGKPIKHWHQCGCSESKKPTLPSTHPSCLHGSPSSVRPPNQTGSNADIQPHIIIKEYYWDSSENAFKEAELQDAGPPQLPPKLPPNTPPIQPQPYTPPIQPSANETPIQPPHQQRVSGDNCIPYTSNCESRRCRRGQRAVDTSQDRPSCGSSPRFRSPCRSPSPCVSNSPSHFTPNHQSTPNNAPGYSFRNKNAQMPKRDGLQETPLPSRPYRKERVIELGSLDDLYSPRPNKRNSNANDNFDWADAQFPEDDGFWGTPCTRRVIRDDSIDEPLMMEREQREERVRCKCKERLLPKVTRVRSRTCNHSRPTAPANSEDKNNLNRCSKCCGLHCPYPSFLYFRH